MVFSVVLGLSGHYQSFQVVMSGLHARRTESSNPTDYSFAKRTYGRIYYLIRG